MTTCRRVLLFALIAGAAIVPKLRADVVTLIDNYGTAAASLPAYYFLFCSGGTCSATEGYQFTVGASTIPSPLYIGDSHGFVTDRIVTTFAPPSSCTPAPACYSGFTWVDFVLTAGLNLTASPATCASVGGCGLAASGGVQEIGAVSWAPGLFNPPVGFSTTLQFQSLAAGYLTGTLIDFLGGSASDPILLPAGQPVGQITGAIGGVGSMDYYLFDWGGGIFSATASITGAEPLASYLFSEGSAGGCTSSASVTLKAGNGFTGTIFNPNLPAGRYCIGLASDGLTDPLFALTFHTPIQATPEPSAVVLLAIALAILGARHKARRRSIPI